MITIELKTARHMKNMLNALYGEKEALREQIAVYKKRPQSVYRDQMIPSCELDIEIIEKWEKQIQEGIK